MIKNNFRFFFATYIYNWSSLFLPINFPVVFLECEVIWTHDFCSNHMVWFGTDTINNHENFIACSPSWWFFITSIRDIQLFNSSIIKVLLNLSPCFSKNVPKFLAMKYWSLEYIILVQTSAMILAFSLMLISSIVVPWKRQ